MIFLHFFLCIHAQDLISELIVFIHTWETWIRNLQTQHIQTAQVRNQAQPLSSITLQKEMSVKIQDAFLSPIGLYSTFKHIMEKFKDRMHGFFSGAPCIRYLVNKTCLLPGIQLGQWHPTQRFINFPLYVTTHQYNNLFCTAHTWQLHTIAPKRTFHSIITEQSIGVQCRQLIIIGLMLCFHEKLWKSKLSNLH